MAAMALSSTSTREQVLDEYANNGNYVVTKSVAEAEAFVAACTREESVMLWKAENVSEARN